MEEIDCFNFKDIKINNVNYLEVFCSVNQNLNKKVYYCLTNVHCVINGQKDKEVMEAINNSTISIPDGMPLVWYGKLLGCRNVERVSGPSLMERMIEGENGLKHYLLGDTDKTISKIIEKACKSNKEISITGHSPPFKEVFSMEENTEIFKKINQANPDVVWVSLGGGKQDKWMYKNVHMLNRGVMVGVGAAFRYYIGDLKVPPEIFQKLGLHWMFRMMGNPKKLFKIYAYDISKFIAYFPSEVIRARIDRKKMANEGIKFVDKS